MKLPAVIISSVPLACWERRSEDWRWEERIRWKRRRKNWNLDAYGVRVEELGVALEDGRVESLDLVNPLLLLYVLARLHDALNALPAQLELKESMRRRGGGEEGRKTSRAR